METIREQTMNKDLGKESKIGIMCATARELAPYLSVMQIRETDECAMHSFHNGTIKDVCTMAVYSGCGKINASITAQLLIDRYDVDAIIFSGIAGGMKQEVQVFDTVVCTASVFHDTDRLPCVWRLLSKRQAIILYAVNYSLSFLYFLIWGNREKP